MQINHAEIGEDIIGKYTCDFFICTVFNSLSLSSTKPPERDTQVSRKYCLITSLGLKTHWQVGRAEQQIGSMSEPVQLVYGRT